MAHLFINYKRTLSWDRKLYMDRYKTQYIFHTFLFFVKDSER